MKENKIERILTDGHTHLEYGPLTVEYVKQFVNEAVNKGLSELQILDHSHRFKEFEEIYQPLKIIPQQKAWLENKKKKFKDSLDDYQKLIGECKQISWPIKVSFGLEVCYSKQTEPLIREILKDYQFDFVVGAIHSVDNLLYDMDFSEELLWRAKPVNEIYNQYYLSLNDCVCSGLFSQLAHPDTIKMFNYYPDYDLKDTYQQLATNLVKYNVKAECNTGCHYRYHHQDLGLSKQLAQVLIENGVEIITASDGHYPKDVGNDIYEATLMLEEIKKEINNLIVYNRVGKYILIKPNDLI